MRFTVFLAGAASAAVADPCTRLCNRDGPAVCTGGSWNKNGVCHSYLFRGEPALGDYCYHTAATADTCPSRGKPVKVADAEAILARGGLRGQPERARYEVIPPLPPTPRPPAARPAAATTTVDPRVAEIERLMLEFGLTMEEALEDMMARDQ